MHSLLLMLLILVPAPRVEQPKQPAPFCGAFTFWWEGGEQCTHFDRDGTCWCDQYGSGTWSEHEGAIWFTEQDGEEQYMMVIDPATGKGHGHFVDCDGCYGPPVLVLIRRGELLMMPRGIE